MSELMRLMGGPNALDVVSTRQRHVAEQIAKIINQAFLAAGYRPQSRDGTWSADNAPIDVALPGPAVYVKWNEEGVGWLSFEVYRGGVVNWFFDDASRLPDDKHCCRYGQFTGPMIHGNLVAAVAIFIERLRKAGRMDDER